MRKFSDNWVRQWVGLMLWTFGAILLWEKFEDGIMEKMGDEPITAIASLIISGLMMGLGYLILMQDLKD